MKKSLIALAALSAFATAAQAQSSVTVYGILDIGYSDTTNKLTNRDGTSAKNVVTSSGNGDGALSTSRLGFKGTEDLGSGNKANFVLEYDLLNSGTQSTTTNGLNPTAANSVSSMGARYSWVGLESSNLGQLRLGRQESSIHSVVVAGSTGGANNAVGTIYSSGGPDNPTTVAALGSEYVLSVRPHAVFLNKAVTYISPSFNGLTVEAQMAKLKQETSIAGRPAAAGNALPIGTAAAVDGGPIVATKSDESATGASLKYAAGNFAAAYGYQQIKLATLALATDTKQRTDALSASYDFGVAKVFALRTEQKNNLETTREIKRANTEVGVQVPFGRTVFWASAFEGDVKDVTATALANRFDADTSGFQLGARYDLSKRTALYAIYGEQELKGTSLGDVGMKMKADQVAVGVRHSF